MAILQISDELHKKLKLISVKTGKPLKVLGNEAVELLIKKYEGKV